MCVLLLTNQSGFFSLLVLHYAVLVNPFTPKSDQVQISPAASPVILHHTVWRTWFFIAYEVDKWLYDQFSLHHSYVSLLKAWENVLLELGSERVKWNMSWILRVLVTWSNRKSDLINWQGCESESLLPQVRLVRSMFFQSSCYVEITQQWPKEHFIQLNDTLPNQECV